VRIVHREQAGVADRNAVAVAGQVLDHRPGIANNVIAQAATCSPVAW
jgi:hypothetical protein